MDREMEMRSQETNEMQGAANLGVWKAKCTIFA